MDDLALTLASTITIITSPRTLWRMSHAAGGMGHKVLGPEAAAAAEDYSGTAGVHLRGSYRLGRLPESLTHRGGGVTQYESFLCICGVLPCLFASFAWGKPRMLPKGSMMYDE